MPEYTVSVIIPCYNEEGNIVECVDRTPSIGRSTEIIVVDDGSQDATSTVVQALLKHDTRVRLISYHPNKGKALAVAEGVRSATGDIIMILDADMTVAPELLEAFYRMFTTTSLDILMGSRFLRPFPPAAMRLVNRLSNRLAAFIFSLLLGKRITDTLCGTKVLWRRDAARIEWGKCRWGDFDILRAAALHHLRIAELSVDYTERRFGTSAMKLFPDGIGLYKRALAIACEVIVHRLQHRHTAQR